MKRILIITLIVCFAFTGETYAQRCLPGMRGIQVTGGVVDGFYPSNKNETGYSFGIAMATYVKNSNKWVFGAEYLQRHYPYKDIRIPIQQFTAEGGYYYKLLADKSKTFFVSVGVVALAGYEVVNRGETLLFDGSTLLHANKLLYGGAANVEVACYLTDQIVLLLNGRERILWGTTTGHLHFQLGLGVKYIIN